MTTNKFFRPVVLLLALTTMLSAQPAKRPLKLDDQLSELKGRLQSYEWAQDG